MKRKTHLEFITELNNKNPNYIIELLEEYTTWSSPIKCRCKVCGFDTYYDGRPWKVLPQHLLSGQGCPSCNNQLQMTHEIFLKKLKEVNTNIEVIGKYVNNATGIRCKCKVCGFEKYNNGKYWTPTTNSLINKKLGCPCCSNKTCITGINDIATTNPELVKYFKNKDIPFNYTVGSSKRTKFICEDCGFEKEMTITNFKTYGFHCDVCNDCVSIPNKFTINLLKYLNINFEPERVFKWSRNKRYDVYIPNYKNYKIIIENHGIQHRDGNFKRLSGKNAVEEKENDNLKKELALNNKIDHYIEILYFNDRNDFKGCKTSVLSSNLFNILEISPNNINWDLIWENSQKNISKEIWELWNTLDDYNKTTTKIAKIIGFSSSFVRKYLKIGAKIGKVNYSPKEEIARVAKLKTGKPIKSSKKIVCLNTGVIFNCADEGAKFYNIQTRDNITGCCNHVKYTRSVGINKNTGEKLVWRYYDEYINLTTQEIKEAIKHANTKIEGKNHHLSKSVICLNTKEIFSYATDASKKYNVNEKNIRKCCLGIVKSCGKSIGKNEKLIWMYLTDYNKLSKQAIEKLLNKSKQ